MKSQILIAAASAAVVVAVLSLPKRSEDAGVESLMSHHLERRRKEKSLIPVIGDVTMKKTMIAVENIRRSQGKRHPIGVENESMTQRRGKRSTMRDIVKKEVSECSVLKLLAMQFQS